ncbi:G-protein coupled receptor family C group 5 member B [Chrysemys picta bellii]
MCLAGLPLPRAGRRRGRRLPSGGHSGARASSSRARGEGARPGRGSRRWEGSCQPRQYRSGAVSSAQSAPSLAQCALPGRALLRPVHGGSRRWAPHPVPGQTWDVPAGCEGDSPPPPRATDRRRATSERANRKMKTHPAIVFLLLFVISYGSSENSSTSRGCGLDLLPQYIYLCDLDAIWGIVVEAVAGAGVLTTLLLMLILLVRLPFIKDKEKKSSLGMHFLFLFGTLGLFGLTFAFIIQEDETVCSTRRFLWGVIFALCFSCLLAQAWRLRRLVRHGKSPSGWHLAGMAICLMLVQVIIATEWLILTVVRDKKLACNYEPVDFVMALIYIMFLMMVTMGVSLFTLCGKFKKWKKNGGCLIITIFFSILIWVAWITMYLFGNTELRKKDKWNDPTLAIALVSSGWVFVIFHAIPEVHCTILPSQQENTPNYFDTSQPRMRETAFEEDIQLPRSYMENKAFSMDEHNAALRTAGFRNGSLGSRPSAPFRSNVYQPTEMAVVLNGGTIPTAPPSYTGRHLW